MAGGYGSPKKKKAPYVITNEPQDGDLVNVAEGVDMTFKRWVQSDSVRGRKRRTESEYRVRGRRRRIHLFHHSLFGGFIYSERGLSFLSQFARPS